MLDENGLRGSFVAHMNLLGKVKSELEHYFRIKSKCWRAIVDHLYKIKDCVIVQHPKDYFIPFDHAHGPCIRTKSAFLYVDQTATVYGLSMAVTYVHEEERDSYRPNGTERHYHIQVPIDLEVEFTQEKFDAWIAHKRAAILSVTREEAIKNIKALRVEFPDLFDKPEGG